MQENTIKMTHRKTPCDVCGNGNISIEISFSLLNNIVWKTYAERCTWCENLLYGYCRKLIYRD